MRKFKLRRVRLCINSRYTSRNPDRAINVVWLDCGHIIDVYYWPYPRHYRVGDKCRCYHCPSGLPVTTPREWHKEQSRHIKLAQETSVKPHLN
jgi:hypothetical protein